MTVETLIARLVALPVEIHQAEDALVEGREDVAQAEEALRTARSSILLDGEVVTGRNAEQREAQVHLATGDARHEVLAAEAVVSRRAVNLHLLQNELTALRSVAALVAVAGGAR